MDTTTNDIAPENKATRPFASGAASQGESPTPNSILSAMLPDLVQYGEPFSYTLVPRKLLVNGEERKVLHWVPTGLNERFFAGYLTIHEHVVFDQDAKIWLRYSSLGYYTECRPEELHEPLDLLLRKVAESCPETVDKTGLLFKFRSTKSLAPIITKAAGLCVVRTDFWRRREGLIPLRNGVLDFRNKSLQRHSHEFHFRGVLPVDYVAGADCPQWRKFLEEAVDADDVSLIQRCFGLTLTGSNFPQKFLLLTGTSQGGKGVIARIWTGLLGPQNVGTLRTGILHERFEIGRLCHKMLIYAGDVPQDFLNNQGAYVLKRIVGQDPESPEFKGSNATPAAEPIYGFPVVTANSRLRVRFEGDKDAWRRRMLLIHFDRTVLEVHQEVDLDKRMLREEAPGILNWALEGLDKLLADQGKMLLTEKQQRVRDTLLEESESFVAFAREGLIKDEMLELTAEDAYNAYVAFCVQKGWSPLTPRVFGTGFKQTVVDQHGITQSHDLPGRGWHGIGVHRRRGRSIVRLPASRIDEY